MTDTPDEMCILLLPGRYGMFYIRVLITRSANVKSCQWRRVRNKKGFENASLSLVLMKEMCGTTTDREKTRIHCWAWKPGHTVCCHSGKMFPLWWGKVTWGSPSFTLITASQTWSHKHFVIFFEAHRAIFSSQLTSGWKLQRKSAFSKEILPLFGACLDMQAHLWYSVFYWFHNGKVNINIFLCVFLWFYFYNTTLNELWLKPVFMRS